MTIVVYLSMADSNVEAYQEQMSGTLRSDLHKDIQAAVDKYGVTVALVDWGE